MIASVLPSGAFPFPGDVALATSKRLQEIIRNEIAKQNGALGFDEYMQRALFEPTLGYYSAGACKFGEAGDFITAPELSPIFAHCLAKQCRQILSQIGAGAILELGGGTGALAVDMLRWFECHDALPDVYYLLEPSADLRERQQLKFAELVPRFNKRVVWLDSLPKDKISGVIIANEVLDAIPVKRVIIDDGLYEQTVTYDDAGQFGWRKQRLDEAMATLVTQRLDDLDCTLPRPYITEINLSIKPWLNALNAVLASGVIILADYGYPRRGYLHPQRQNGTLVCHYRHRRHDDPFLYPGLQDISAAVDFTAVAEAAFELGLHVAGFTTQAHFLIGCKIDEVLAEQTTDDTVAKIHKAGAVNTLMMPEQMGEQFKFIGLTKSPDLKLMGFSFVDFKGRL